MVGRVCMWSPPHKGKRDVVRGNGAGLTRSGALVCISWESLSWGQLTPAKPNGINIHNKIYNTNTNIQYWWGWRMKYVVGRWIFVGNRWTTQTGPPEQTCYNIGPNLNNDSSHACNSFTSLLKKSKILLRIYIILFFFIELLLKFLLRTNGLKWLWAPAERCIRVLKSPLVGLNFSTLKVINDISFSLFAHMFLFLFLFLFVFLSN
jgi:hypothetical protein